MKKDPHLDTVFFSSLSRKLTAYFVIAALILAIGGTYFHYVRAQEAISKEINNHLETAVSSYETEIKNYFVALDRDAFAFSQSSEVHSIVDAFLWNSSSDTRTDIAAFSKNVTQQIEQYIKNNPGTIEDLQNDSKFRDIVLQTYGKSGYTQLIDYDTFEVYIHPNPLLENSILTKKNSVSLYNILERIKGGHPAYGFYTWTEPDGTTENKYADITILNQKTIDGKGLALSTTAYTKDCNKIKYFLDDAQKFLRNYVHLHDFNNLYLINLEGLIIWSSNQGDELSANLNKGSYRGTGLSKLYQSIKAGENDKFTDIEYFPGYEQPVIFVGSPVYDSYGNVMAVAISNIDSSSFYSLFTTIKGLPGGEAYLINRERFVLTPLKSDPQAILTKRVFTENSRSCYSKSKPDSSKLFKFEDHNGKLIIGKRAYIPELDWCLLVELSDKAALGDARRQEMLTVAIIILLIFMLSIVISLFISRSISNPIKKMYIATKELEQGDFTARTHIKTHDELQELGEAWNRAAEALQRLDTERKGLDKAKTEFLSITSHELRSPMTPMKAQLQMLLDGYFGELSKKQKHSLDIILRNASRLDNIIKDFLEVSRIEAARMKFDFKKTRLTDYIKRLVEEMDAFLPEKSITLDLRMEKLPLIEVDPDRVMQVLRNLINNAKKFSSKESTITIEVKTLKDRILIQVTDQGMGINKEDQKRLFEPFFQAEHTIYREHGGTGLGLAICKGIIESQNGNIWVESQPGKGAKFSFTVPFKPVKKTKPIKLLFSEKAIIERKLSNIFREVLGPIGDIELEDLSRKGDIAYKPLEQYVKGLHSKGIITDLQNFEMLSMLSQVFKTRIMQKFKKKTSSSFEQQIEDFFRT